MGGLSENRQWHNRPAFAAFRAASCIGKTPYVSKAEAMHVVAFRAKRGKARGMRAYRCDCCKRWHVGGER
jgi:hypothetical protein